MSGSMKDSLELFNNQLQGKAKLIAVSKYHPMEKIVSAYDLGQRDFGESRVQELCDKAIKLKEYKDIIWHFIGHLQTNKVKMLLQLDNLASIHSVHSLKLLKTLIKEKKKVLGEPVSFFLQVNTSNEEEKSGFETSQQLIQALQLYLDSEISNQLVFEGLMTMGKIRTGNFEEDAKDCFNLLHQYGQEIEEKFPQFKVKYSMGMSDDYKIALQTGTDYVRIGSAIFGEREY